MWFQRRSKAMKNTYDETKKMSKKKRCMKRPFGLDTCQS